MNEDLSDLIDNPRETLEIELKSWLKLKDPVVRANLARHIAALSNHGGGYLVFGFQDNLKSDPDRPPSLSEFNRDTFNAIIKKYLSPSFQCNVVIVSSATMGEYSIVRVPSHGVIPVCAKQNGPNDTKGKPQGIRSGEYYVRVAGPESIAITLPQDWTGLIRRCTLNDREALLKDVALILRGREAMPSGPEDPLLLWHRNTGLRFGETLRAAQSFSWPVPLERNAYQLSYSISHDDGAIPLADFRHLLEELNHYRLTPVG